MDDFGVLVQTYGIRPQGKSAPMAASKTASRTQNYSSANVDPFFGTSQSTHSSNSGNGSILGDQNDVFGFGFNQKPQNYSSGDVFDDVLQMPTKNSSGGLDFDMEAMFKGSMNLNAKSSDVDDNVIWGFSGNVGSKGDVGGGDLLSSDPVDDFLGTLGNLGRGSSLRLNENKGSNVDGDDLIPGFGSTSSTNVRAQASSTKKSSGVSSIDELEDFGLGKMKKPAERAQASSTEKKSSSSSLDELEDFGSFMMKKKANGNLNAFKVKNEPKKTFKAKPVETNFIDVDIEGSFGGNSTNQENVASVNQNMFETEATDLDSFFGAHSQKSKPVPEKTTTSKKTEDIPDLFSGASFNTKKKVSPGNSHDDFSMLFGASPTSTQFEEIEGESEDRRRARLEHFQATQARMAQALAELNEREFRAQQEQEERHRIADAMEIEMKRWAAGKEGNLRALLSSLQQVLAPGLGWKPVTLTDLITSSQVKIAYKKAALCVHPDKVQQKGASLQQKYVAEKIFDLLKEAWNKFNSEELR